MSHIFRTAYVYVGEAFAGTLQEADFGYRFQYDAVYLADPSAAAVSLTLPVRAEAYRSETLFPFFDGLIPEGWLLNIAADSWKLDRNDRFGLLLVSCRDCIGNVSIREARL